MGPGSTALAAVKDVRAWTAPLWMDAGGWAVLALGLFLILPDSVPAVLAMLAAAASYRLLPDYAFAAVIVLGAVIGGPTKDLEWTFAAVIGSSCYLARRKASRWWWVLAPIAAAVAIYISESATRVPESTGPGGRSYTWGNIADQELNPTFFVTSALLGLGLGFASNALDKTRALESEKESLRTRTEASEEHGRWLELRTELARELHDLIGHHVTAMVVQAEAGLVGDSRHALTEIGESGRHALGELDALVRYLRDPANSDPLTTVQGLQNVDALAMPLERQGVTVHMNVDSNLELAETVELAAYRIVQESLTNVARHAQASTAWVTVEGTGEHTHVRVSDDGIGPPERPAHGTGLAGIGERVAAHHGVWTIGVRHGGGTTVDAYLIRETVAS